MTLITCLVLPLLAQPAAANRPDMRPPPDSITIRVLDEHRAPVPNALLGTIASRGDAPGEAPDWVLGFYAQEQVTSATTDEQGRYAASARILFRADSDTRPRPLIALSPDRSRVGLATLSRADLGDTIDVTLAPACRVRVKSTSSGLEALGRTLTLANVYVLWNDYRPFGCSSTKGVHEFLLPPGEYKLDAYSTDTYSVNLDLTVKPGDRELSLVADLPPNRLATLIGKPAPELVKIKGWKNGAPVTLADLKGKVVLLDFWGYWCSPCVRAMPDLVKLYETYKDQGLVVIAVHDDSVASIEEMDEKLKQIRVDLWDGKDLPFLVALDGGGETPIEGSNGLVARGATTAAYGIQSFPTQILIGRDGNVIGRLGKGNKALELLKKELERPQ